MLFTIPAEAHTREEVTALLKNHPEVMFVSLMGVDIGGHDTDEKIPVGLFIKEMDQFFSDGVQTDGSSVVLPKIASLNNAKVDIIPDMDVNWYVDYNFHNIDEQTGLPVGTLRIPSMLFHNDTAEVGSRSMLKRTIELFEKELFKLLREHPYVFKYLDINSVDEIKEFELTGATELEFWVKTPEDKADREQLSTSQELKEQYWQRTRGPVRTALERAIHFLDQYGFGIEMGHKEVGGIKAKLGHSGRYDHIMEQLEIDWKYSTLLQSADNELHIRYVVKDIFRAHGLDVTFMAKPIEGVAGNGAHTHMGVNAILKDGRKINLFAPKNMKESYLTPIGYGALMGILKNYEIMTPFIASTNDAINRLKEGFEAPVCIVTSLGHTKETPSRNRTVLIGLIRDEKNPLSTRFELRSPNPKTNKYLVLATSYLAMLDGIEACLKHQKTPDELERIISKKYGEEVFYLEKDRAYRSEEDVYKAYTKEERDRYFGKPPETVWESIQSFDNYPEKLSVLQREGIFDDMTLESYKEAIIAQWAMELHHRIVPNVMDRVRECRKCHEDEDCTDLDLLNWDRIQELRIYLGQDRISKKSLLTRIKNALDEGDYQLASDLQKEMQVKIEELTETYVQYKKNLF
ncbi:MAG TPA: glutamine synthetase [Bacillota bacterium]|jgi:glutamine synthetase|nr:glutamine synthetase [Clostridiales bacterium UBA9856]HOA42564.1 glutamine synthetase [Bacillota bacterium]HPZ59455.1 glutamine synthetase [Bacillota bacterium]HQC82642.1 glutamine synthetase [Bacillota bacterium]